MKNSEKQRAADKKRFHKPIFGKMQASMAIFLVIICILIAERRSVVYEKTERLLEFLEPSAFQEETFMKVPECLIVWDSTDQNSVNAHQEMAAILTEMRIPFQEQDGYENPVLSPKYENYVLALSNYSVLGEGILDLFEWVENGSNLLVMCPPYIDTYYQVVSSRMGIQDTGYDQFELDKIVFKTGFMVGGMGQTLEILESFDSSNRIFLDQNCKVHLTSGDENEYPVLWEYPYGQGNVVCVNLNIYEKAYRGFYAAAYSQLSDVCVYPVINGAAFYLDDFPSPVPSGEGKYIKRDYNMDIEQFYANVWWPDMVNLAKEHGIRYTSVVIENYSAEHQLPLEGNQDTQRFLYFGNEVLNLGGEIGYHGYNHMPLVLENFDYGGAFESYYPWKSEEDIRGALTELRDFCSEIYPREEFHVYVPPSNILSEEGRRILSEDFLNIRAVASIYFEGEHEYSQDFMVSEDGIVETPRITSGLSINSYMRTAALSELNFHYVSSHFVHPDDALDEERGAAQGWQRLYENLSGYMGWLYDSAPQIRRLIGTEMAGAVERYYFLDTLVEKQEGEVEIRLSNFQDEAWLFARVNEGTVSAVQGGSAVLVADDLYLVHAAEDTVRLILE